MEPPHGRAQGEETRPLISPKRKREIDDELQFHIERQAEEYIAAGMTPQEARRTMALIAGIYASAFTRRPVTPSDLAPGTAFYTAMNGGHEAW